MSDMKMEQVESTYKKKGQVASAVQAIITLILGTGVATLLIIFVGVLGGQVYNQTEDDILELNTTDPVAYASVQASITSGFEALELTGGYLPIVILAVIIFVVLGLVLMMGRPATGQNFTGAL